MENLSCPDIGFPHWALLIESKEKDEPIQFGACAAAGVMGR
jgi:hypothetical protein